MSWEDPKGLITALNALQQIHVPVCEPAPNSESFILKLDEQIAVFLDHQKVTIQQKNGEPEPLDQLESVADWLFRLVHPEDVGGYQEYSANFLADWLEVCEVSIEPRNLEIIGSVLAYAWANQRFSPRTRQNIAHACIELAVRSPKYTADMLSRVLAEIISFFHSNNDIDTDLVECYREVILYVSDVLSLKGHDIPSPFPDLGIDALKYVAACGVDVTNALVKLHNEGL